ncbi:MAG: BCCT family transporter [Gammaproteobacteria bacterium]|jgi:choline/glycine/proline betaine transport protein|nr:BCCT family transporter [Gammaproteobacteria bacterium]
MTGPAPHSSRPQLDKPVFFTASVVLGVLVLLTVLFPAAADRLFTASQAGIVDNASWYYVLVVAVIFVAVVMFAVSGYGDIKLGPDHSQPEYSFVSWFAMLFAAGMGIGLMFFGVAEPVMHFINPPVGAGGTVAAAREAMTLTFFHWGLHAWAVYVIVAMILAYFSYRQNLPLTLRSALYPLIGERIYGPIGTAVDVFAIVGTVFGVATSLGLGVQQINAGLNHLFGLPESTGVQLALIAFTTVLATISVLFGLDRGIKRLSEINIALAVVLAVTLLLAGPTVLLLQTLMQNTGVYLSEIVGKTFNLYAYDPTDWLGGWTIFYWGWWISWAPFVGLFIARISRGRTLREFVIGALLAPTLFTFFWMTVFGNSAIDLILNQGATELAVAVSDNEAVALFRFFEYLPLSSVLSMVAICMVLIFFVTSADSGAMVLNMLCWGGADDTPAFHRVYWMAVVGGIAMVLLVVGGLAALQTAAIASAFPFSVALLLAMWGFRKALALDYAKRQALLAVTVAPPVPGAAGHWKQQLANLVNYPTRAEVDRYLLQTVRPALERFRAELQHNGIKALLPEQRAAVRLEVWHGDELDFIYEVRNVAHPLPDEALVGTGSGEAETAGQYYRAEVHFTEGGQDYCIMGWSEQQIIADLVEQYGKHLHFLHVLR